MQKIRIYQLKSGLDLRCIRFTAYSQLNKEEQGKIKPNNYDKVFDGEIESSNLELIYSRFNYTDYNTPPSDFKGRSMSISDVIELYDDTQSTFYYCNDIGFKEIKFK